MCQLTVYTYPKCYHTRATPTLFCAYTHSHPEIDAENCPWQQRTPLQEVPTDACQICRIEQSYARDGRRGALFAEGLPPAPPPDNELEREDVPPELDGNGWKRLLALQYAKESDGGYLLETPRLGRPYESTREEGERWHREALEELRRR